MPQPAVESKEKDVKRKLSRIARALEEKYGPHIYPEESSQLDGIVFALLAARNPVTNARKAMRDLREEYVDWNEVRVSTIRQLEDTLEKARIEPRARYAELLKALLESTFREVSRVDLESLRTDGPEHARRIVGKLDMLEPHEQQYLLVSSGVEEAPPLDPATDRCLVRIGVFAPEDTPQKRRRLLESLVAGPDALRFHHLFVEHGKKLCTEEDPKCPKCPAQTECEYARVAEAARRAEEKERERSKRAGAAREKKPERPPSGKKKGAQESSGKARGASRAKPSDRRRVRTDEDE